MTLALVVAATVVAALLVVAGLASTLARRRVGLVHLVLTGDELARIDEAAPVGAAQGDRYPDMSTVHR